MAGALQLLMLVAAALPFTLAASISAQAQFFDDRFPFFDFRFDPQFRLRRPEQRGPPPDNSRAPAARKIEGEPSTTVVVMGDSMADWLAYGLELAYAEMPDIAVLRKHSAASGLVRNDTRADHPDWVQNAREFLAVGSPTIAVMMIGLHDRHAIRERAQPVVLRGRQAPAPGRDGEAAQSPPREPEDAAAVPPEPGIIVPETRPSAPVQSYEFRSEKWSEAYAKRIDDTVAALKSRGVAIVWVGLPPIRGTRATGDMNFLNELFRARAERAGIVYVDLWDGFADENGRYVTQGADFEGQTRRLRSADGVHFTKAGARKLAHYVEREIQRVLAARTTPVALPFPQDPLPQTPESRVGGPTPRPLVGPVIPLTAVSNAATDLLGAEDPHQAAGNTIATHVLVKGEPIPAPAGRADDFAWPRRGVAPMGTDPAATTTTMPVIAEPPRAAPLGAVSAGLPSRSPGIADAPAAAGPPRPPANVARQRRPSRPPSSGFFVPFFR
ncbi:MAG: DUF459 domain-containing protein [Proteobacteria bacterium]|nr:DUF459 domain-containing protein [Pseudomonadota bacterium]